MRAGASDRCAERAPARRPHPCGRSWIPGRFQTGAHSRGSGGRPGRLRTDRPSRRSRFVGRPTAEDASAIGRPFRADGSGSRLRSAAMVASASTRAVAAVRGGVGRAPGSGLTMRIGQLLRPSGPIDGSVCPQSTSPRGIARPVVAEPRGRGVARGTDAGSVGAGMGGRRLSGPDDEDRDTRSPVPSPSRCIEVACQSRQCFGRRDVAAVHFHPGLRRLDPIREPPRRRAFREFLEQEIAGLLDVLAHDDLLLADAVRPRRSRHARVADHLLHVPLQVVSSGFVDFMRRGRRCPVTVAHAVRAVRGA